ncbi:MAG: UDP-N-acetylmuramoyl-L-alanine--D-glutamate ligase [Alphaproteobacteria bacterium]|nr:UDP-N-acetylmuramoyl-L-alanine--D-glutamate ligase [Alphaproteobacteria bacterium]
MIPIRCFQGQEVAIFGLARSGQASLRALKAGGANAFIWDDNPERRDAGRQAGGIVAEWREWPSRRPAALILSPGVPLTHPEPHPVVRMAKEAGIPIIGDFELFARELKATDRNRSPVIAVTGTNGKSTTTALLGHVLKQCGFEAQIGGNIGQPVLDLEPPGPKTAYVVEISTFQIDLAPGFAPDISLLLNLSPDHIDRHGSMENYAAAKEKLVRQTLASGHRFVGVDDKFSSGIFSRASLANPSGATPVSVGKVLGRGVFVIDGVLYDARSGRANRIMELSTAKRLVGAHNWQNIAFAFAAASHLARDTRQIVSSIGEFPGLAHRMEDVGRIGRVRFVNDSKATNAAAAERAISCFPDIFWIAGGRAKEGGIESLSSHFRRIRKAYLVGEAAKTFAATLENRVSYEICPSIEIAVAHAATDASRSQAAEPVVLLSPACSSYDQFRDFEERGDSFRDQVAKLLLSPEREAS